MVNGSCLPEMQESLEVRSTSVKAAAATFALVILGAAFIGIPVYTLLIKVYSWHLKQPETVQGGLELIAVFLLLAGSALWIRRPGICGILILGIAGLYLQLHSILVPAVVAFLFFCCLLVVGGATQRIIRAGDWAGGSIRSILRKFIAGVSSWTLGALILSLIGFGTIPHLRIYTIVVTLGSFAAAPALPFRAALLRRFEQLSSRERILILLLLLLLLAQFGKINYGIDYDSTWYELRPERVLTGPNSFLDDLKLMHYVYYYPKQFEVLTLPLADLNKGTFIIAANVVLLLISFFALFEMGRSLGLSISGALLVTALVGSIPAFSNMASSAKTDTLLSVYAYLAALFLWSWCSERRPMDLSYAGAALLGMAGTKISAYAYAPLLAFGFIATVLLPGSRTAPKGEFETGSGRAASKGAPFIVLGIALLAYCGLTLRTWVLTGLPTMPAFPDKWMQLGLSIKYPWSASGFVFSGTPITNFQEFILYWWQLLFDPKIHGHYVMAWPGNAGVFAVCAILILVSLHLIRFGPQSRFLCACLPIMIGGILTACLVRDPSQGGTDGNYYVIPIVLTILSGAGILASAPGAVRKVLTLCACGFILVQLPIMFVSHWSWHPGTQAFSFALNKPLFDQQAAAESRLKSAGAWEIEQYLRKNRRRLCVGFSDGEESALHMLSCVHEDFEQDGGPFWRIFDTTAGFREYLAWAKPDLFIMPKSLSYAPSGPTRPIRLVFEELLKNPKITKIESRRFWALDLSRLSD